MKICCRALAFHIFKNLRLFYKKNVAGLLISGPLLSTKYTKHGKKQGQEMTLTFNTHLLSFT